MSGQCQGIWAPAATHCVGLRDSMWPGIMIPSSGNGYIYQAGWRRHQLSTQPVLGVPRRLPAPDLPINPNRGIPAI